MLWTQSWHRPRVGYSRINGISRETHQTRLNYIGHPKAYNFHDVVGNTNFKGRWSWKLADNVDNNADGKCYDWYAQQPGDIYLNTMRWHGPSDCPCLYWQVIFDRRYRYSSYDYTMICYEQRRTWGFDGTSISFHTRCCYERRNRFLINYLDLGLGLATQRHISSSYSWYHIFRFGYYRRLSRRNAATNDAIGYEYCCRRSPLCNLYEEKRPIPTCSRYVPPVIGTYIRRYTTLHIYMR